GEQIKTLYNGDGTVNSYSSNGSSMFLDKQGNVAMAGSDGRSVTGNNYTTQAQTVNQQKPPYMRSGSTYLTPDRSLAYTPFASDGPNFLAGGMAPEYSPDGYSYATQYSPALMTPQFSYNGMSPAAYTLSSFLGAGMMAGVPGYGMGYPMMGYGMGLGMGMGYGMGYGMMGMGLGLGALTMGAGMLGTAIGYNLF
ncbi:MAG: hypothetical protein ABRQ38_28250, partial [Candidatus Eremiobacterota bacterium]